jgi:FdhD protein
VNSETTTGLSKVEVIRIDADTVGEAAIEYVPAEAEYRIVVNGGVETSLHCAPHRIKSLIVGWLICEGVIDRENDFVAIDTDLDNLLIRVTVSEQAASALQARALMAPVGRLSEPDFERRVTTDLELRPEQVADLAGRFKKLFLGLKSSDRMCYLAAFAQNGEIQSYGEGFHRVNAMYRALGELVIAGVEPADRIALTNFGLTRQMTRSIARAGVCMAICAAPPSNAAIEVANDYYLSIVSTAIGGQLTVYSAPWRVI